ncbi:hypothetical protein [Sapientia aquatica]|uniref:Uncharacterized protein n=1 Tax=Sapientia aquatica TaxID=1549640 RepID=A0A4R5VYK9_9BURK|nr:hypothetical protein [Sapientia aquatica]TDK63541.1 hypothetical protein E2I14_15180 [Sapientia aquatica]
MKFLKNIFTEDDNETFCIAKFMAAVAFVSYLGYAGYGLYLSKNADITNFANGIMQVLVGCGGVIGAKQATQKKDS